MQTENIKLYLAFAYSDEKLAQLLAFTEEGGLGFLSCCCLIGCATADHGLVRTDPEWSFRPDHDDDDHYYAARRLPFALDAESEFNHLGHNDAERRQRLIPIICEEMERREKARAKSVAAEPALVG